MNTNRRFSFRFWLCNMIFGDALKQAITTEMIVLEDMMKVRNIYYSRLDSCAYHNLLNSFDHLLRIVYGIDHNSLEFNEEGSIVNKPKRRFKICNLIYFGSLSDKLRSSIRLLYALTSYLNATDCMYTKTCSDVIGCIIRSFDRIMY